MHITIEQYNDMLDFARGALYNRREYRGILNEYDLVHGAFIELFGTKYNVLIFRKEVAKIMGAEGYLQKSLAKENTDEVCEFIMCKTCRDVHPSTAFRLRHREGRYWLSNICRWCERNKNAEWAKVSKTKKHPSEYSRKYMQELHDNYIKSLIRRKYPGIKSIPQSMISERRQQIIQNRQNKHNGTR